MLTTGCTHCGHKLAYDERHAGKTAKCPKCGERVLLSGPTGVLGPADVGERGAAPTEDEIIGQEFGPNEDERRHLKILGIFFAALLCVGLVATLIYLVTRDTWEQKNSQRILNRLEQADKSKDSDMLAAFQIYDEVLREASGHKVQDIVLQRKLEAAQSTRDKMKTRVDEIRETEAGKEVERERTEKARREAERQSREKEKTEEEVRKAIVAKWRNVPKAARDALNAVKKVEARTEVGVNRVQYAEVVGQAWADVKLFAESPEGKEYAELTWILLDVMGTYKEALDDFVAENPLEAGRPGAAMVDELQKSLVSYKWTLSASKLKLADMLLDPKWNDAELVVNVLFIRGKMR